MTRLVSAVMILLFLSACGSSASRRSVSLRRDAGTVTSTTTTTTPLPEGPRINLANLWGTYALSQAPASLPFTQVSFPTDSALGSPTTTYAPDGTAMAEYFGNSTIAPFTIKESKSIFSSMDAVKSWLLGLAAGSDGQAKVVILKAGNGLEYGELSGGGAQSLIWQTPAGTRIDVLTSVPTTVDQLESIGAALTGSKLTPET